MAIPTLSIVHFQLSIRKPLRVWRMRTVREAGPYGGAQVKGGRSVIAPTTIIVHFIIHHSFPYGVRGIVGSAEGGERRRAADLYREVR